jgi:hypothetical protein
MAIIKKPQKFCVCCPGECYLSSWSSIKSISDGNKADHIHIFLECTEMRTSYYVTKSNKSE